MKEHSPHHEIDSNDFEDHAVSVLNLVRSHRAGETTVPWSAKELNISVPWNAIYIPGSRDLGAYSRRGVYLGLLLSYKKLFLGGGDYLVAISKLLVRNWAKFHKDENRF